MGTKFPQVAGPCLSGNGTTHLTLKGYQYVLYCDTEFIGSDLRSVPANSYEECLEACDDYKMSSEVDQGPNCVAVVYRANNPESNRCRLKYRIGLLVQNNSRYIGVNSARRVQYQLFADPVYTAFAPVATQSKLLSSFSRAAANFHSPSSTLTSLTVSVSRSSSINNQSPYTINSSSRPASNLSPQPIIRFTEPGNVTSTQSVSAVPTATSRYISVDITFITTPLGRNAVQASAFPKSSIISMSPISGNSPPASTASQFSTTSYNITSTPTLFTSSIPYTTGLSSSPSIPADHLSSPDSGAKISAPAATAVIAISIALFLLALCALALFFLRKRQRQKALGNIRHWSNVETVPTAVAWPKRMSRDLYELPGDLPAETPSTSYRNVRRSPRARSVKLASRFSLF